MVINDKGLQLIKSYEGLRLNPYKDPVGLWTVGYGHLIGKGTDNDLKIFKHINKLPLDEDEADSFLFLDLGRISYPALSRFIVVKLSLNQFSALASFIFNIGPTNFRDSTLLKELNKENYHRVPYELSRWVKGTKWKTYINKHGKKVSQRYKVTLPGLVKRRESEAKLFCTPD